MNCNESNPLDSKINCLPFLTAPVSGKHVFSNETHLKMWKISDEPDLFVFFDHPKWECQLQRRLCHLLYVRHPPLPPIYKWSDSGPIKIYFIHKFNTSNLLLLIFRPFGRFVFFFKIFYFFLHNIVNFSDIWDGT